jgi:hypothetical protein
MKSGYFSKNSFHSLAFSQGHLVSSSPFAYLVHQVPVRSFRMLLPVPEHWHLGAFAILQGIMWNKLTATHWEPFLLCSALYPSQQSQVGRAVGRARCRHDTRIARRNLRRERVIRRCRGKNEGLTLSPGAAAEDVHCGLAVASAAGTVKLGDCFRVMEVELRRQSARRGASSFLRANICKIKYYVIRGTRERHLKFTYNDPFSLKF